MSRVRWARALVPPAAAPVEDRRYEVYDPPLVVPRTRAIPEAGRRLVALPDRRAYRALPRSGLLLAAVGLAAHEALEAVLAETANGDRYRAGIYCALDAGPQNYRAARDLLEAREDDFAEGFRKANHPKLYFTQLVNLPAAHLGIFLDLRGPVNVYSHSRAAAAQALEQAELDLELGLVDAALLCSAFSLEDPLLAARERRRAGPRPVLCEGAAALVLTAGGTPHDPSPAVGPARALDARPPDAECYGIADAFVALAHRFQRL